MWINPVYDCDSFVRLLQRELPVHLLVALFQALRPRQWTKNLVVFAAPLFAFSTEQTVWFLACAALFSFCLISSSIYLVNDCLDIESDRAHPVKSKRPIPSGKVSLPFALSASLVIAIASFGLAASVKPTLLLVLFLYGLIQIGYCIQIKQIPLLDLFCIASGFLLRAIAGAVAAALPLSPWFLLTVGLLALFLAIEKRKAELRVVQFRGVITRQVLERYSLPLLLRLESTVATSAFVSYSLWAAGPALKGASTSWMLLTVPFVLMGIFRYQLLSDPQEAARRSVSSLYSSTESPEELLLGDRGIQLILVGWMISTVAIGFLNHAV